ncbi:MAG: SPOR domain-containing protein [Acidimicrobiia bacterium]
MAEEWYYCLDHGTVEPRDGCRVMVRIGPFATREEASRALETVERRNEAWEKDPEWSDEE